MRKWPSFPSSKRTSYEWLPFIPEHWDAARLRRFARIETGGTPNREVPEFWRDGAIPWLSSGEVNKGVIREVDGRITEAGMRSSNAKLLPGGSVVIALNGQGRTKGTAALLAIPSTCNQSIASAICDLRRIEPRFLHYYAVAKYSEIRGLAGEQRDGLSLADIRDIPVPLPPVTEQRGIADFLDRETSKIDAVISARQRHIELIGEEFEARADAIMSRAGDLVKLRRLWSEVDYGISETGRVGGVFPVLTMGDIHEGVVSVPKGEGVDSVDQRLLLRPADLLFNRTNSRELVGKVGLYRGPAGAVTFASYLVRLRCNDLILPEYANLLLNSRSVLAEARSRALLSVNQANLNPNRYSEIEVRLPSVAVQAGLLKELADARQRLSDLRQTINLAVERLREYRVALITAAVTGQIDVRSSAS